MKKLAFLLLILTPLFWTVGCKEDNSGKNNNGDSVVVDDSNKNVKTFYLVPSPEDVFGFADDKNLTFYKDLLNPTENLSKYNDVKLQEFNFGVYAADLAFCAASNKNDETVQYLNVVRELSQDVGLSDVFNESLVYRIEHISPVKDSLISLSNDTYFDIMRYLERNDRQVTLSIMAAGGWLECMYLVVNQVDYDKDNVTVQKIADQRIIIANLWRFLEQSKDDPNVKSVLDELQNIYNLYNELEAVEVENNITTDNNETVIVVGGNNKFVMNKQQYEQLKKYIVDARNKLTLNNVTF